MTCFATENRNPLETWSDFHLTFRGKVNYVDHCDDY